MKTDKRIILSLTLVGTLALSGGYVFASKNTTPAKNSNSKIVQKDRKEYKTEAEINSIKTAISLEQAKKIALNKVPGATVESFELESSSKGYVFEIDVVKDNQKQEFKIDANTGDILKSKTEKDKKDKNKQEFKTESEINSIKTAISLEQAKKIAMGKVPGSTIESFELESSSKGYVFEIDVVKDNQKQEFKIDANTGNILASKNEDKHHKDKNEHYEQADKNEVSGETVK